MTDNYILENVNNFDINEVLTCGQCFNFTEIGSNEYIVTAMGSVLRIKQEGSSLVFYDTNEDEFNKKWNLYFDLERDYEIIKDGIVKADPRLEDIIEKHPGIRILNQEFFETLISFIISQNKQIPQIKQVVRNLSEMYGTPVPRSDMPGAHLFPTEEELKRATDEGIRSCKAGFRAPYILDAVDKVSTGAVVEQDLKEMPTDVARKTLMQIKGVGEKVANCVLLFGLGRRETFPVDVWMKRIMEHMYFHKDTPKEEIEAFAVNLFGENAGYAQQYLFMYAREAGVVR